VDDSVIDALVVAPNPTDGRATVALTLAGECGVRVAVYDVLGRRAALLHDGALGAGAHAFAFDGSLLPSGVYVVRVEVEHEGNSVRTYARRLTLTD
jgi:hypothetical protein